MVRRAPAAEARPVLPSAYRDRGRSNEEGVAEAAVSLSPAEARRLAAFIVNPCGSQQGRLAGIVEQLRADVERAFARSGR